MDRPELDTTPYTVAQIETVRRGLAICQEPRYEVGHGEIVFGPWAEYDHDGLTITKRPARFGDSWSLNVDGVDWMQTNPVDMLDHAVIHGFTGRVLLTGLGLGVGALFADANPNVTEIIVIERDTRVIEAILPMIRPFLCKPLGVAQGDADTCVVPFADCAFLDHHEAAIPESVVQRYRAAIPRVVCWFDEHEAVKRTWQ